MIHAGLVALVAALHVSFLVLEMILWQRPFGRRVFRLSVEDARTTATLAANQGLYNGFLAAGLIWARLHPVPTTAAELEFFFLGCVVVAGLFGAVTVSRRIFYVQSVPALLALALGWYLPSL